MNQIRALLPDLVRFAFIPASDHRINAEAPSSRNERDKSPDIYAPNDIVEDEEEHVLVMEFVERSQSWQAKKQGVHLTSIMPRTRLNFTTHLETRLALPPQFLLHRLL
jgi:hypothetical protein